jgi:hypothetical protein
MSRQRVHAYPPAAGICLLPAASVVMMGVQRLGLNTRLTWGILICHHALAIRQRHIIHGILLLQVICGEISIHTYKSYEYLS